MNFVDHTTAGPLPSSENRNVLFLQQTRPVETTAQRSRRCPELLDAIEACRRLPAREVGRFRMSYFIDALQAILLILLPCQNLAQITT